MGAKKKRRRNKGRAACKATAQPPSFPARTFIPAVLIFTGSFLLYLRTLCPTIYTGDSPTFSATAWLLGIAHPPGYPLFSVLGKIFCALPLGDVGFRTNLGTALLGSGAVTGLYYLSMTLGVNRLWAAFGAAVLAVSKVFWDQCLGAEVYTLHAFLTVLVLTALFSRLRLVRKVSLVAFLLGLSMTNHFMSIFLYLAAGAWLFDRLRSASGPALENLKKLVVPVLFFVLLGVSLYLYLPLRAVREPGINWGVPGTAGTALHHVMRKQYRQLEFGSPYTPDHLAAEYRRRKASFRRPGQSGFYSLDEVRPSLERTLLREAKLKFTEHFIAELGTQFGWVLLIPGVLGGWLLFRSRARAMVAMTIIFVLNSVGLIAMLKFPFDEIKRFVVTVYYIPCYLISAVLIAVGMQWLEEREKLIRGVGVLRGAAVAAMCALIFLNLPQVTKRRHFLTYRYGKDQLGIMRKNAVAILYADGSCFPIRYLQEVCGYRRDVTVVRRNRLLLPGTMSWYWKDLLAKYGERLGLLPVTADLVYHDGDLEVGLRRIDAIIKRNKRRYPVYTLNAEVLDNPSGYRVTAPGMVVPKNDAGPVENVFFMDGLLERLVPSGKPQVDQLLAENRRFWLRIGSWRNPPAVNLENYLEKETILNYAKSYSHFGTTLLQRGRWREGAEILKNTFRIAPMYGTAMHNLGHIYHQRAEFEKAEEAYRRAIASDPDLVMTMNNLGVLLLDVKGELSEARRLFQQVMRRAPGTRYAQMAASNLQRLEAKQQGGRR